MLAERFERAREWNIRARPRRARREFQALLRDLDSYDEADLATDERVTWAWLLARSWMGLAQADLACTGDLQAALGSLDRALGAAQLVDGVERRRIEAVTSGQRGMFLLNAGELEEAVRLFDRVLAVSDDGEPRDLAVAYLNRASALSDLGDVEGALADNLAAVRHAEAAGTPVLVAFARHNSGFYLSMLGDAPAALAEMAAARMFAPDQDDGIPLLGRAEVLYSVGLLDEAETLLGEAIPQLLKAGLRTDRAIAEYFRARCLLALLRFEEASAFAARARRHFTSAGYEQWAVLARVLELEAALAPVRRGVQAPTTRTTYIRGAQALAAARDGDAAGLVLGQHPGHAARLVAAQWFLLGRDLDAARAALAELPRGLTSAPLTMRIQHYTVQAELSFATGDRAKGLRAVRAGLGLLANHRSRLGSVESVTAAAAHGEDLNRIDVTAAARTGRPAALFDALERGRATFAGTGRVTPPDDAEAAALLTEARGLLARARELPGGHARERERLSGRARRIQDEVRERSWRHAGNAGAVQRPVTARELRRILAERGDDASVVANFFVLDSMLRCVRVDANGLTTIEFGPAEDVTERVRRVGADFAMAANELIPAPLRAAASSSLERNLKALDTILLAPVRAQGDLYVVAREPLLRVPWSALPSRGALRTAVNSYVARGRTHARPSGKRRLLAAAGPGVAQGADEAAAVGLQWAGATVLTGDDAVTEHIRTALATHDVVHLATHGQHDADNPLFASIDLADGPLFAHELDGTPLPGSVVILSSCEVGGSTQVLGGEVLGLTSVLLRLGARAVIASVAKLSDELAARVMPRLHAHLRETDDPEAALAAALKDVAEPVPLVCFSSVEGLAVT
ncbi:CHAT domain-containing protein [Promicromonospora soli]|uniref:CHAT domain-containing protein n=1 Tax=Promicromonospora soli TaxID=2035533 RepID=A0A919FU90_9MICO|nr:CHAT domain-containing tetratricopeptide repeat protein [Promicromonospora soli]GHH72046.1 CHAT domain-containing protein [Promicromonospora soli]